MKMNRDPEVDPVKLAIIERIADEHGRDLIYRRLMDKLDMGEFSNADFDAELDRLINLTKQDFDALFQGRENLVRRIWSLYRPYMIQFPQTPFKDLLIGRYNVEEASLMTIEQLRDLVKYMQAKLEAVGV